MKLAIFSDLHIEFGQPWELPAELDYDVLVLAGDIDKGTRGLDRFAHWPKPVVYVMGNHEAYGQVLPVLLRKFRQARTSSVHFLENSSAELGGVRFLGTTLWTDFALFGPDREDDAMAAAEQCMSDYRVISVARDGPTKVPLSAYDTQRFFEKSSAWIERTLAEPFDGPTVVVTHHLPAWGSVATPHLDDLVSAAYASDLSSLIERYQPDLWIHGHTHTACDYKIGRTRVVCNPRGYPGEADTGFRPDLVVEIGSIVALGE